MALWEAAWDTAVPYQNASAQVSASLLTPVSCSSEKQQVVAELGPCHSHGRFTLHAQLSLPALAKSGLVQVSGSKLAGGSSLSLFFSVK